MKVREIMTTDLRTCRAETNLAEAVNLMWEKDCGVLPIVKADGTLTGVVTDRDICIALATRGETAEHVTVGAVTTGKTYTCVTEDDISTALQTMKAQRVRRLPVTDRNGRLKGMLSLNDVVTHPGSASPAEIVNTMASICEHRQPLATAGV